MTCQTCGGSLVTRTGVNLGRLNGMNVDTPKAADTDRTVQQEPGATACSFNNCIEDETCSPPPTPTCVDCGDPPMPGGVIRCKRHMLEDLNRRVWAKPIADQRSPRESNAVRQVRTPSTVFRSKRGAA